MKTCTKCGEEKPGTLEFFPPQSGGLRAECRECKRAYKREYNKKYWAANKGRLQERNRAYYWANRERLLEANREWNAANAYHLRPKAKARANLYAQKRRKDDPKFRVRDSIASGVNLAIRDCKNGRHWETLVGYTLDDLTAHLESQFTKGMTWDNYGYHGWHIDHIRPVADFNFTSPEDPEFRECWSLWNLRPMWGKDNIHKGTKCEAPPLPLLPKEGD